MWAWLVSFIAVATFLSARHIFSRGGVRRVIRWVATIGLVVSGIALAQEATASGAMYWRWPPLDIGAPPFGPFVNRNHFGTWVILAVPLVLGYLAAHATAHARRPAAAAAPSWQARLHLASDARTLWLAAAVVTMIVALAVSLSRSAMFGVGLAIALLARSVVGRSGVKARFGPMRLLAAVLVLAVLALLVRLSPETIVARVAASPNSLAGRMMIWRDTIPLVSDFWLTGTGAGTYDTVMLVYQRSRPGVRFNQAHNHYLQLAAEGGLMLGIPVLLGLFTLLREAGARVKDDESGMYYVRAGALCGLAGVAAQSLFETGLTTPANAILAAIVAAIAIHIPMRGGRPADS